MKKVILVLIISLLLTIGIFVGTQILFSKANNTGELQVTSQPQAKVYLNNQYLGTTPICRCAASHNNNVLQAGDYTISLEPANSKLSPFLEHITVNRGVLTVVDHTFADGGFSSGSTLQLVPVGEGLESSLVITSFPTTADVLLDDNPIGQTPVEYKNPTESDHEIIVKKNGYADKTLHIRTPKGYTLQATVYLAINPNPSSPSSSQNASSSATLTSSPSATLEPSPVVAKVTILDTPTGYLNVRSTPSLGGDVIEQVKPGDSLYLLSEQDGWYQIKLPDNKIGWVSNQYAEKNGQ